MEWGESLEEIIADEANKGGPQSLRELRYKKKEKKDSGGKQFFKKRSTFDESRREGGSRLNDQAEDCGDACQHAECRDAGTGYKKTFGGGGTGGGNIDRYRDGRTHCEGPKVPRDGRLQGNAIHIQVPIACQRGAVSHWKKVDVKVHEEFGGSGTTRKGEKLRSPARKDAGLRYVEHLNPSKTTIV